MDSVMLRQLWTVVEETQTTALLKLSDSELVRQLIRQLHSKRPLSSDESITVSTYLCARTELIRDLAHARTQGCLQLV